MSGTFAVLLISPKGEKIDKLLLHMTQPVDGQMDERASYVALSRATALDNLFMVGPITLDQLRHKPKQDIAAALGFLQRLDKATVTAFLDDPSVFTPVTIASSATRYDRPRRNDRPGQHGSDDPAGGRGCGGSARPADAGGNRVPLVTFLAPNSQNNCFFNASIASTLAAYDGQPLLSEASSTPSARKFFSAVDLVRRNMHRGGLPEDVLVRCCFAILRTCSINNNGLIRLNTLLTVQFSRPVVSTFTRWSWRIRATSS